MKKPWKRKNILWQVISPLFYLPPNIDDVFLVHRVHTGQFKMSKSPACMDSTNRSIVLGLFLSCKWIGKLNFVIYNLIFTKAPYLFCHVPNFLFALWSVDVWSWILGNPSFSVQEGRELSKSGGWQENILKLNVSILPVILFCDSKTVTLHSWDLLVIAAVQLVKHALKSLLFLGKGDHCKSMS